MKTKVLNFMVAQLAHENETIKLLLETEVSYNKHLQDDLNNVDDLAIAIDKANDKRVIN